MTSEPNPPAPIIIDEAVSVSNEAWNSDLPKIASLHPPTLERCTRAIAEVRERYEICQDDDVGHVVWDNKDRGGKCSGSYEKCQAWIDREAARGCIGALLPVSEALGTAMYCATVDQPDVTGVAHFTAALTAVLRGEA